MGSHQMLPGDLADMFPLQEQLPREVLRRKITEKIHTLSDQMVKILFRSPLIHLDLQRITTKSGLFDGTCCINNTRENHGSYRQEDFKFEFEEKDKKTNFIYRYFMNLVLFTSEIDITMENGTVILWDGRCVRLLGERVIEETETTVRLQDCEYTEWRTRMNKESADFNKQLAIVQEEQRNDLVSFLRSIGSAVGLFKKPKWTPSEKEPRGREVSIQVLIEQLEELSRLLEAANEFINAYKKKIQIDQTGALSIAESEGGELSIRSSGGELSETED